jgi:hypothetical protein
MSPPRVRVVTTEDAFELKNPGSCRMLFRARGPLIQSVWRAAAQRGRPSSLLDRQRNARCCRRRVVDVGLPARIPSVSGPIADDRKLADRRLVTALFVSNSDIVVHLSEPLTAGLVLAGAPVLADRRVIGLVADTSPEQVFVVPSAELLRALERRVQLSDPSHSYPDEVPRVAAKSFVESRWVVAGLDMGATGN